MISQKIMNLLNEAISSSFVTRKWDIVNVQSNTNYIVGNEIIYSSEILKSNLCDYINTYLVSVDITNMGHNHVIDSSSFQKLCIIH